MRFDRTTSLVFAFAIAAQASLQCFVAPVDFGRWLYEEVAWIITPEERKAFLALGTAQERAKFEAEFWKRRAFNTTQESAESARKEHYRRLAHANRTFQTDDTPGWKTDRGRVWILHGPPDEIRAYPNGPVGHRRYLRDRPNGYHMATPYAYEQWFYLEIEGFGGDVELEFVEITGAGVR